MSGKQVYLGSVVSSVAWVAAWTLVILAAVFESSRLGYPGLAMVAVAAVATMRSCLAQHDRHIRRAIDLQREASETRPPNVTQFR